jgi:hypothetical protein
MGEKRQDMTTIIKATSETPTGQNENINARVTYRNAPMHLLEKFTFKDVDKAHKVFLEGAGFDECVILQTCNRVEIFGAAKTPMRTSCLMNGFLPRGCQKRT